MTEPHWDIEFDLSDAEYRSFCRSCWWRSFGLQRLVHLVILMLIALSVTAMLSASRDRPFVLALIWVAVGHYVLETFLLWRASIKYWMRQRRLLGETVSKYRFDSSGVSGTFDHGSFQYNWIAFEGIWRFGQVWALRTRGGSGAIPLPTRVLTDELRKFIRARALAVNPRRSVCLACGYDLRGQLDARCPECGTPFAPELLKK